MVLAPENESLGLAVTLLRIAPHTVADHHSNIQRATSSLALVFAISVYIPLRVARPLQAPLPNLALEQGSACPRQPSQLFTTVCRPRVVSQRVRELS